MEGKGEAYSEHVLALAIENAGARLEVLAAQELGEGQRDRVGRSGHDGLGLTRAVLVLVRVGVLMGMRVLVLMLGTGLALLGLLLLRLHPLGGLSLEVLCSRSVSWG
jgi:hypothetical protein